MNLPKPYSKKSNHPFESENVTALNCTTKTCINMEELMQFEAARQRALQRLSPETNRKSFSEFVENRVFINNVDTFNSSHYAKFLSDIKEILKEECLEDDSERSEVRGTDEEADEDKDFYDDNSQSSSDRNVKQNKNKSCVYEIFGTLDFINNPNYVRQEGITELLDNERKNEFLEKVLTCGYIVYDITTDLACHPKQIEEAKWVAESIYRRLENMEKNHPKDLAKYNDCRTFILVSTLLTWAKTKPLDPDDPTLPFTEKDYRKRKPHPNYKIHNELEKRIIEFGKKFPKNFRTIVIGSGVTYGDEEDILHMYFKMAWQGAPHLPIFSPGTNVIPVIHVNTLSSVIYSIIESFPQRHYYMIAVDPQSVKLKPFVKLLAKKLGNGKTRMVSKEEAFLYPNIKTRNYDMLTMNVNVTPGYIMDKPTIIWASDRPLDDNLDKMIEEFKRARGLMPVTIFIHGPPASGKSFMAKRLSEYYDVPHLHVKGVINETIQNLEEKIQNIKDKNAKAEENEDVEQIKIDGDETADDEEIEEDEDAEEDIETLEERLREIKQNMDNEKHRLDEEYVIKFFKEKMLSNNCQNKGYVIDGYPKTMEHTKMLYDAEEGEMEEEANEEESVSHLYNVLIMPTYVESLDGSDEFLIERVIKMPEARVQNSHYEEPEMCRRLAQFRAYNTEDNTPLIYYDELDIHPMIYNIEKDLDPNMEPTFQAIISRIGPPRNYGKEVCELEAILNQKNESFQYSQLDDLKLQRDELKREAQERRDKMEHWMFLKSQELEMEEKALLVMGMPLRHYLMKYIFPTLTRGLVEVARLRPEDPIDFLSEFLFRENPEGKMFQPNYEEREEKLELAIKEYERSILSRKESHYTSSATKSRSTAEKSARSDAVSGVSGYKCSLTSSKKKSNETKRSGKSSQSSSLAGVCTCGKSPSDLSTCSSDFTPLTPTSCTCVIPEPCEPCDPCDEAKEPDPCKCLC